MVSLAWELPNFLKIKSPNQLEILYTSMSCDPGSDPFISWRRTELRENENGGKLWEDYITERITTIIWCHHRSAPENVWTEKLPDLNKLSFLFSAKYVLLWMVLSIFYWRWKLVSVSIIASHLHFSLKTLRTVGSCGMYHQNSYAYIFQCRRYPFHGRQTLLKGMRGQNLLCNLE